MALQQELIEKIFAKVKKGEMTAEEANVAIERIIEEAGTDVPRTIEDSPAERRIKFAAQVARRMS